MPINRFPVQLRFGDEDSNGHVNNVRFVQFLEEARVRLSLLSLGSSSPDTSAETFRSVTSRTGVMLVARQEIEYLTPLVYREEPVWVEIWVTGIGASSLTYGFRITDDDGGRVYAHAEAMLVMADAATGRSKPLSAEAVRILEGWRGEPVPFRGRAAAKAGRGASEPAEAIR